MSTATILDAQTIVQHRVNVAGHGWFTLTAYGRDPRLLQRASLRDQHGVWANVPRGTPLWAVAQDALRLVAVSINPL